jgi:hypothetical protein
MPYSAPNCAGNGVVQANVLTGSIITAQDMDRHQAKREAVRDQMTPAPPITMFARIGTGNKARTFRPRRNQRPQLLPRVQARSASKHDGHPNRRSRRQWRTGGSPLRRKRPGSSSATMLIRSSVLMHQLEHEEGASPTSGSEREAGERRHT